MEVGIIVLAAGGSSRMGRPKQLLRLEGETLVRRAADTAVASTCGPVVVVLGAHSDEVRAELEGLPVTIAENPEWEAGMGTSIAVGMAAVEAAAPSAPGAIVIMLCDQPGVTPAHLKALVSAWQRSGSPVASEYGGAIGVPALLPSSLFPDLGRLSGAAGAKSLLRSCRNDVIAVPFLAGALDIDTPEEYARAVRTGRQPSSGRRTVAFPPRAAGSAGSSRSPSRPSGA